jgi:hypothetical protein
MWRFTALVAALVTTACATEVNVVKARVDDQCTDAFKSVPGNKCTFTDVCAQPAGECCANVASCKGGIMTLDRECKSGCGACTVDEECPVPRSWCENSTCIACPENPPACEPCPRGFEYIKRNGCQTCMCTPRSECDMIGGLCNDQSTCYQGAYCASGCRDPNLCCANQCEAAGCVGESPEGCKIDCPSGLSCTVCTALCRCEQDGWICTPLCNETAMPICSAPN